LAQARKFKWSTVIGLSISAVEVGSVCFLLFLVDDNNNNADKQQKKGERSKGVREGAGESVSRWDRR